MKNNNSKIGATSTKPIVDTVVEKVRAQLLHRSIVGIRKYGVTLDREDLNTIDWIDHAIEECLDMVLYLTRLKEKLSET